MRGRHAVGAAPEIAPADIEGGGRPMPMTTGAGGRPLIQPFQMPGSAPVGGGTMPSFDNADGKSKKGRSGGAVDNETLRMCGLAIGGVWLLGWMFLGYEMLWPIYLVFNILSSVLSFPPFSWIFGWFYRGAPLLSEHAQQVAEEMQLPQPQVAQYMDQYVNQYGDAALIFSAHDGYPQIVKGLLYGAELGYRDLVDARDEGGNTALIYAAAKGFRQCVATLLRNGADPDIANSGAGGRTALMEAAGSGQRDIVMALRLTPNITLDIQDDSGNTALHYAAYHGHLSVVIELLKSNPNKAIQNIYGHTATSYAETQKQKAVVDALSRDGPTRQQRMQQAQQEAEQKEVEQKAEKNKDFEKELQEQLKKLQAHADDKKKDAHVKGSAEDLHKNEDDDFAPKTDEKKKVSEAERAALEEQLSRVRKSHDEAELKSQKRIVELLEKSTDQQRVIDEAESSHRAAKMNNTDLNFRLQELESKHRSSELHAEEEASRANSFQRQHEAARLETESHQRRAEAAERERDQHKEAANKHQDSLQRVHDEISGHQTRQEQQHRELQELRDQVDRIDSERRKHMDRVDDLEREMRKAGDGASKPSGSES